MSSPLRLLRDLLPFSAPHAERKHAPEQSGVKHIKSGLSAHQLATRLFTDSLPKIDQQTNLHMRFKLLEELRHQADEALPVLEKEVTEASLPLPVAATRAAILADNLIKGLAQSYADIAHNIHENRHNSGLIHLFNRAVRRAIVLLGRRQLLAYRAYAAPSPASWLALHELYRMACATSIKTANDETATIKHEYLSALLFAYIEPGKMSRADLSLIQTSTRQLASSTMIMPAVPEALTRQGAGACFFVRGDESSPGYPLNRLPAGANCDGAQIVDCGGALAALERNLARQPGQSVQPDLKVAAPLLQSMRNALDGQGARRFSRTAFRPRADLVGGLEQVIRFLDGNACSRRSLDDSGAQGNQPSRPSEWSLIDESPDGFRIRFLKGEKCTLGAGDVVALQPRESSKTHVCLVRRVILMNNKLELGLQLLSPQVSLVDLTGESEMRQRAIFLHSLPAYGKFSGLIAPPGKLAAKQHITLKSLGQTLHRQIGKCFEANEGLEFVALELLPD